VSSSLTVRDLGKTFNKLWPLPLAEEWDAPGFSISHSKQVKKVLLTVDVTPLVLAEANHKGANLILSHHPFLMRAGRSPSWDHLKGALVADAIRSGISLYAAHTNADVVPGGVSDTLAKRSGSTR